MTTSRHAVGHCKVGRFRHFSRHQASTAMTMIELIGLLAVISIFAVVLLRSVLREIDSSYARQESATLKSFGDALQNTIMRNGYIPSETNWAAMTAAELGLDVAKVTQNSRGRQRVLLIDNSGWFTNGLPYTQTYNGTFIKPINARFIIASSVGSTNLPVSAGALSLGAFLPVWTNAPGSSPWAGIPPDDLKIERIDLLPLFVRLYLVSTTSPYGQYSIGTNTSLCLATNAGSRYYLQSSVLRLYQSTAGSSALDSTHVLIKNVGFRYEGGLWKSSSAGGLMLPGGMDIAGAAASFLNATANTNALNGAAQQKIVVKSFMNYMSNYIVWANSGFPNNAMKTALIGIQSTMMSDVQGIFQKAPAGQNFYPINNGPCL